MPPNPVTPTAAPSRAVSKSVAHRIVTSADAGGSAGPPSRRSQASTSSVSFKGGAARGRAARGSPAGLSSRTSQRTFGSPNARARSSTASTAPPSGPDGRNSTTVSWDSK